MAQATCSGGIEVDLDGVVGSMVCQWFLVGIQETVLQLSRGSDVRLIKAIHYI